MLVKKKNPEYFPSENKSLKVGETVEITDPRALIVNGDVVGLAEDGVTELSTYELYGVIVQDEAKDFQEYLQFKKAEAAEKALKAEKESLRVDLAEAKKEEKPVEISKTATEIATEGVSKTATEAKKN